MNKTMLTACWQISAPRKPARRNAPVVFMPDERRIKAAFKESPVLHQRAWEAEVLEPACRSTEQHSTPADFAATLRNEAVFRSADVCGRST
jgi:hypothetical protein